MNENQSIASVVKKKTVCQRDVTNKAERKFVGWGEEKRRHARRWHRVLEGQLPSEFFWFWFRFRFSGFGKKSPHTTGDVRRKGEERKGKEREGRGFRYPYLPAALRRLLGDTTYNITWYKKKERKDRGTRETPQAFFHGHWCRNGH